MLPRNGKVFEFKEDGEKHYAIADTIEEAERFVRDVLGDEIEGELDGSEVPTTAILRMGYHEDQAYRNMEGTAGSWSQIHPKGFLMSTVFAD